MEQTIQQYFRDINHADWQRAQKTERLLLKAIPGWDPEDCVIAHPRTGLPVRLETPGLSVKASHAARWLREQADQMAGYVPGAVLAALADLSAAPDSVYLDFLSPTKAQKARSALRSARVRRALRCAPPG
jgi:hypothetical protein